MSLHAKTLICLPKHSMLLKDHLITKWQLCDRFRQVNKKHFKLWTQILFRCQKQNKKLIRDDVWVPESGGYEMIIFTEYEICVRHFSTMLSVGDIRVPYIRVQKRTLRNGDNRRHLSGTACIWIKSNNDSFLRLQQFFIKP